MRNGLTEIYHLTKVVGEANGLLQPVDPDLDYFVKTSIEAAKWQVTTDMFDELFGPFQLEQLFDTYKRSLENHLLMGSEARTAGQPSGTGCWRQFIEMAKGFSVSQVCLHRGDRNGRTESIMHPLRTTEAALQTFITIRTSVNGS